MFSSVSATDNNAAMDADIDVFKNDDQPSRDSPQDYSMNFEEAEDEVSEVNVVAETHLEEDDDVELNRGRAAPSTDSMTDRLSTIPEDSRSQDTDSLIQHQRLPIHDMLLPSEK